MRVHKMEVLPLQGGEDVTSSSYANRQSPRIRIETKGAQYLSDAELLATLINSGTKNNSALNISYNILKRFNLRTLSVASIEEL